MPPHHPAAEMDVMTTITRCRGLVCRLMEAGAEALPHGAFLPFFPHAQVRPPPPCRPGSCISDEMGASMWPMSALYRILAPMSYGPGRHQWPQSWGMCPSGRLLRAVEMSRKLTPNRFEMFSPTLPADESSSEFSRVVVGCPGLGPLLALIPVDPKLIDP